MFFGLFAKLGLNLLLGKAFANAKSAWAAIPPKLKLALLALALLVAAFFVHRHYAHKALKAADQAGYARRSAEDDAALAELRTRARAAEANAAKIAQEVRTANDKESLNIAARADALQLRGPGAARCGRVDHPALSAGAGGREPASGTADAAVAAVPDRAGPDLIAVPFGELVERAKQCDLDRSEALSWREADGRQRAEWEKLRGDPKQAR